MVLLFAPAFRREIKVKVIDEPYITNMNRLDTLVEVLGISAALENGDYGDEDTAKRFAAWWGAQESFDTPLMPFTLCRYAESISF